MLWLVLTGTYMAGVIAGAALVLWAEKVNEPKRPDYVVDSSGKGDYRTVQEAVNQTNNSNGTTFAP